MPSSSDELIIVDDGPLLTLTVNRPDKFNPLSRTVLAGIRQAIERAAARDDLRCVVVRGAGNRYFAAGGDLRDLDDVRTEAQTRAMLDDCRGALDAVRFCPVPVLAVLNGDAIGGGAELAVACDFRIVREGTRIGYIHGRLNISSAWGGGTDLHSLVGRARALRMTSRSELVPAATALAWGLVDEVHPEAALEDGVSEFLSPLLSQSPVVLRACKAQAIAARRGLPFDERRDIEAAGLVRTWTADEHWRAVERIMSPDRARR